MRRYRWMGFGLIAWAMGFGIARDEAPITLRMIGPEDIGGAWREIIRRFHARYPHIRVQYISGPWSTDERQNMYIRSFLSGDPFELVYMDVTWTAKFAANGWLLPLDRWFSPKARRAFLPADIEAGMFEGHIYRVPVRSDVGVLYYRKDLIDRPPATWDDLARICAERARPPDLYCIVFQGMQYEGLVCNFMEYYWGTGGPPTLPLNASAAVRALRFMRTLMERRWAPPGALAFQEQHALEFFANGRALFMRNWPYAWTILNGPRSGLRGRVGIAPLPHDGHHASVGTLGGWGLGIARRAVHPEAAWRFIAHATSLESQKILHFRRGAVPSRRALYEDPEIIAANPHYPKLYRILLQARPRPVHPAYPRISDTIQKHVSAVLAGVESPEEATEIIVASIRSVQEARREIWITRVFQDYDLHRTLWNTLVFTVLSVPLEFLLGLGIALLLNSPLQARGPLRLSVLIPWALPTAVMAMAWQWMFNDPFGVINDVLVRLGMLERPYSWLTHPTGAMAAAVFADVWKTTPFVVIILLAGLQTIPRELADSFAVDGGGTWAKFFRLTFPLLLPFIRVALIFRVIHAAGIFDLIWVLTRGGPADRTRTLSIYIYDLAFRYDDLGYALFLTGLFLLSLVGVSLLIIRITTLPYERVR